MSSLLVPIDGSECSARALDVAIGFAGTLRASLVLCHVVELSRAALMSGGQPQLVGAALEELRVEGKQIVDDACARVAARVEVSSRSPEGEPAQEIDRLAQELQPAFVVMGSHGRTGLSRLVMGSVAEGVIHAACVPVMVVPCLQHGSTAL